MPDLYLVTVVARKAKKLQLSVQPTGHGPLSLSVGPSFARMLIEESCAPGHDAYAEWKRAKQASDEDFWPQEAIASVEVIADPNAPWPSELSLPLPEDIESKLGAAVVEIGVDDAGMISHLKADASWLSTAFDELEDGKIYRGEAEDVRVWKRAPKRRAPVASAAPNPICAYRLIEQTAEGVCVEFITAAELPGLSPASWTRLLSDGYPGLNVHADYAHKHIARVEIDEVQGTRDMKASVAWVAELNAPSTKGALRARYRILAKDRAWLTRGPEAMHPFATRAMDGWIFRGASSEETLHRLSASSPSDVSNFEELLEMGRLEGRATELEMLTDGLQGTRDVVVRALEEVRTLGAEAAPLATQIAASTGALEVSVATLALDCAAHVGGPMLASAVALATLRLDAEVAEAAKRALKVFALLPNWMR
jgi:hypothetical protein